MSMRRQLRWRETAWVLLVLGIIAPVYAEEPPGDDPDWWATQRDVVAMVIDQKLDVTDLAAEIVAASPQTGRKAMFKLNVLMRAGLNTEAVEAVKELKSLCPDLDNHQVGLIYYSACDEFLAWELAQNVTEVFAKNISEMSLENRLLKHFLESDRSVNEIDRWLASMPAGRDGFWIKQRLRFNNVHGRGEQVAQELTEHIKQDPQDIERVVVLLDGLIFARHTGKENWSFSWMPEAVQPQLATDAEQIAKRLQRLAKWEISAIFYSRAIGIPLTEEEAKHLARMSQRAFADSRKVKAGFAAQVREGLAKSLLEMGRNDEAQKWMVEAADIRAEHRLGLNALFAGRVQGASGQRVIESRIEEEEEQREGDPEYWRKRALYYHGRNEPAREEHALKNGLALTTSQARPKRAGKGHMDMRRWLLSDYARFLERMNRTPEAVALLREEIEQAPADTLSAEGAAHMLAFDFPKHVTAGDEVLWTWLAHRPKWEHTEIRLLWRMLESVPRDDVSEWFIRAEALTKRTGPSRAYALGWIMNRMQHPKRSIPLLQYAVENAQDDELKKWAAFTLFESYLDTDNWKQAEQIFMEARKQLSPREVPHWYSRLAVVAVGAGASDDAMRIWRAAARINPSDLTSLRRLIRAGLRAELAAFYQDMAGRLPSSETPARALKMLGDS